MLFSYFVVAVFILFFIDIVLWLSNSHFDILPLRKSNEKNKLLNLKVFITPQSLSAVRVLFLSMVSGWAGGGKKFCPGCISETVRCRKLILGRDIG